ncbi:helix-turn-helix domain-containing protein [Chryseobacterium lathyri]|uniref:AAA+ superfamily ATPase n=1 Tax=Chryseobacterium lathyri TaxID=395933 RepID=A0ABT9SN23_9FLAO|nr:helix-turn-helix domain-containing protein [Chryseobacterium lathyri]MDP9960841.1 putative AAA+ superfamily ATPase [Chryseobacterium lathyri]MDQ0065654.1 putative AAA+ superfamily ATPase [Chryseobacterium lathyri]
MPNYKKLYTDIISYKNPKKWKECSFILAKAELTTLDIINLNEIIFTTTDKEISRFNQQHKSYDKNAIIDMLTHQHVNKLNNTQLAIRFKLSRNSVAKWKKKYTL